jgi:hypothetical protein
MGDVGIGAYIAATGHRIALDLHDLSVQPISLIAVGISFTQMLDALTDLSGGISRPQQAALRIESEELFDRLTKVNRLLRILHQL